MADNIKTLNNLLKIAKKSVEDTQKSIAQVLAAISGHEQQIAQLQKKIKDEGVYAGSDPQMMIALDMFTKRSKADIKELAEKRMKLLNHEAQLREELSKNFAEEKRYQILLERKQAESKKLHDKKQQQQLDEIAATRKYKF